MLKPAIIYPDIDKVERSVSYPFRHMMRSFESSIGIKNTRLLIIGFGFKDNHIAGPIVEQMNKGLRTVIISKDLQDQSKENLQPTKISIR